MDTMINNLDIWAKGDALQGKIMFVVGMLLLILLIYFYRNDLSFFKGMIIPLGLFMAANLFYGGFMTVNRPNRAKAAIELMESNPIETVKKELEKGETDHKNYSRLKPIWVAMIILSAGLYFFFSREWYQGLSLGLVAMFFGMNIIDFTLHHRLKPYLEVLRNLSESTG